ncbi:MAG: helicase-associated domain-containing protein, partial [Planctomycetota bacterium]|nr:helicase-associated domain-containing protein [Planctomycetota bacterium]
LPGALVLRKHLDGCTMDELREFLRFWGPHEKLRKGRGHLVSALRKLMADENVVYGKVDLLSEKVRAVLMALLKKQHYTSDLAGLFRGIQSLEIEHYEAEAALTALSRRGFVRASRAPELANFGRSAYAIPKETALVMRGLAGTDHRALPDLFVHADFKPSPVHARSGDVVGPLPESPAAAVEALDEDLRPVVRALLGDYGGLLTRKEYGDAFQRGPRWDTARFLGALARSGLGTVGHLDLRGKGIGVDDDAVICFSEAVERFAGERRNMPLVHDRVVVSHGDLQSDIRTTFELVRDTTVKVSKEGQVYKAAAARIAEHLQLHVPPLIDKREAAERAISILRGLDLVRAEGNVLAVTEAGAEWIRQPLLDKARAAYGLLHNDGARTLRARHLRGVHRIVVELLEADSEERGWWPGSSLALLARNRHLLAIARDENEISRAPLSNTPAALTELGRAAQELVTKDLFALGVVDVALRGSDVAGVRLSRLGARLLAEAKTVPADTTKPLIVNPDYEVLVLPEGDVDDLLHDLDRIAVRERAGEVVHYRLDRRRIEHMCVDGEVTVDVLDWLQRHARTPVPQNVVYSIEAWGSGVRSATMEPGILLRGSDETVIQAVLHDDRLKPWVAAVLDDTSLLLKPGADQPDVVQALRALGVYLRES